MKRVEIPLEERCGSDRRTVSVNRVGLEPIASLQTVKLTLDLNEPYHTNTEGKVLCLVITGWMEAHCNGVDYKITEGQGIIFEPGERHRINKGEGWMLSASTKDYDTELGTKWEKE